MDKNFWNINFYRERFAELFDEKARELNKLETDYSECKKKLDAANRRLVDSDYKGKLVSSQLKGASVIKIMYVNYKLFL